MKEGKLKDVNNIQEMLKDLFAEIRQEILEGELDDHLGNISMFQAVYKF